MRHRIFVLLLSTLILPACGADTVVHGLGEREANKIVELLAENDISGQKVMLSDGRTTSYSISVPLKSRIEAIRLLNRFEIPRRADNGYTEVFKDGGLIPTAGEEKAKQMAALEGEIEKQLRIVDGILDVQVQLVQPEENALRNSKDIPSPVTASVTIKYLPGAGGAKPLSEPQVQAVVAAGVERLTPDNVVVVMTPSGAINTKSNEPSMTSKGGVRGINDKYLRPVLLLFVCLIVVLGVGLVAAQLRLRTVRGRLMRLQSEIAKARRKANGDGSDAASLVPPP